MIFFIYLIAIHKTLMKKTYKKNFQDKLKSYSALAGTIIAAANTADAQIVYTDIIPDSTVTTDGGSYDLDLNNDGTFDFTFNLTINPGGSSSSAPPPYNKVGVAALNSNLVAGSATGAYIYPLAMNAGDTVKPSLTWNMGTSQSMGSYWGGTAPYGNWLGKTNKFIGLKLDVSGSIYYGWARLDVTPTATAFTIKDYAYMNAVNQPIVAGASASVGIVENNLAGLQIYNDNRRVFIRLQNAVEGTISINNTLGQEVYNSKTEGTEQEIGLADVKAGIYFVSIRSQNIRFTKKIIIN